METFTCIDQMYDKDTSIRWSTANRRKSHLTYMLPFGHQIDAFNTLRGHTKKALSAGTGSGKTVAVAMLCLDMLEQNKNLKIIIPVPQLNIGENFRKILVDMSFAGLGLFNPGIVMYDSIEYPDTHEDYFPRIMYLLTELDIRDVLVVWNFVIKSRFHRSYDTTELSDKVHQHYLMSLVFDKADNSGYPWEYLPYAITYRGSGKGHQSTMATAFYYRK